MADSTVLVVVVVVVGVGSGIGVFVGRLTFFIALSSSIAFLRPFLWDSLFLRSWRICGLLL